jgi:hypothetical protein
MTTYANAVDAIINKLQADTLLVSYLAGNSSGAIMVMGRALTNTPVPFITVGNMTQIGSGYADQYTQVVRVRVYATDRDKSEFYDSDRVIARIKLVLNKADLSDITNGFISCLWSGVTTQTLYDFALTKYYLESRFNVQMALAIG